MTRSTLHYFFQEETMTNETASPLTPQRIMQMAFGYAPPLILEAALRHRVFDVLDEGPKTLEQVAAATGASQRGLRAVMNALVGLELLSKNGSEYSLTPESSTFLVSGKPAFHGGLLHHTTRQILPMWMELGDIVRDGRAEHPINNEEDGVQFFQDFVESLFPMSYAAAQTLGRELKVDQAQQPISVLDLAAGSGVWGIALAQQSPQVRVTAVDWAPVLQVTRRMAERFGVAGQFTFSAGDLHEADFGSGHNIATLGHILHSEGEERSRALLAKTFDALAPGGHISIAEFLVNEERTGPLHGLIFAVNMLVSSETGDTFSFGEISGWLGEIGFENARLLDAPSASPLILATKPA
jgi:ubiquinone/menaquinone biosynthesis C-methylase UbiE